MPRKTAAPETKRPRRGGPRPLPDGYVGLDEVCRAMGLAGPNSFGNKRRYDPDSVPPLQKMPGGRLGIKAEELAAWIAARNLRDAQKLSRQLANLRRTTERVQARAAELIEAAERADHADSLAS